jgi:uncharacterized protein (DUF433 family)
MALPGVKVAHPHVELASDGSPMVRGSRVPVRRLWAWHRRGTAIETLLKRYPNLGWAKLLDALAFAYDNQELVTADLEREREALGTDVLPPEPAQTALPFTGRK